MNEDIKAAWVKALRSGEYGQGTGHLRDKDEKFCCLGVLCDVVKKDERSPFHKAWAWFFGASSWIFGMPEERTAGSNAFLPEEVREWVGLGSGHTSTLMRMNDFEHRSFNEIADWIEVHC